MLIRKSHYLHHLARQTQTTIENHIGLSEVNEVIYPKSAYARINIQSSQVTSGASENTTWTHSTESFFNVIGGSQRGLSFRPIVKSVFQQTSDATKSSCKNPQICLYYKLLQDTMWISPACSNNLWVWNPRVLGGNVLGRVKKHEVQTEVW